MDFEVATEVSRTVRFDFSPSMSYNLHEFAELSYQAYQKTPCFGFLDWELITSEAIGLVTYAVTCDWSTHVIFVTKGTTITSDWKKDNIPGALGAGTTEYLEHGIESIKRYLSANTHKKYLSFTGHSMGGRLSDLFAAYFYSNWATKRIRHVRMFDSPGTQKSLEKIENFNKAYLDINRIDLVGQPNTVNMSGKHASYVLCLCKYGGLDADIPTALNEQEYLVDIETKHSINHLKVALKNPDKEVLGIEHWGSDSKALALNAQGLKTLYEENSDLLECIKFLSGYLGVEERVNSLFGEKFVEKVTSRLTTAKKFTDRVNAHLLPIASKEVATLSASAENALVHQKKKKDVFLTPDPIIVLLLSSAPIIAWLVVNHNGFDRSVFLKSILAIPVTSFLGFGLYYLFNYLNYCYYMISVDAPATKDLRKHFEQLKQQSGAIEASQYNNDDAGYNHQMIENKP